MNTRHTLAIAAVAALALSACSSSDDLEIDGMEANGYYACQDFATGYEAAQTTQARLDLADKVNKWAAASDIEPIKTTAATLARVADANPSEADWQLAADTFATSCFDNGWGKE